MSALKNFIRTASTPSELKALLQFSVNEKPREVIHLAESAASKTDLEFCYDALTKVSRSFAIVIQQLPEELKDVVCVFYLILRGLDTVEDDMTLDETEKERLLRQFYRSCYLSDFKLHGIGDTEDYRLLLQHFDKVTRSFNALKEDYKEVISDICFRMGNGMADSCSYEIKTVQDYDIYCHYVAGLVGQGLSELFAASGYESEDLAAEMELANSMGLLLQKTNITRDFLEDFEAGRVFLPKEIWGKYHAELSLFASAPYHALSLQGLNALIENALNHFTDSVLYLQKLRNQQVFRFCAIPQLMALATLIEIYDNPAVFMQNVKIRKSLSAKIIMETTDFESVKKMMLNFISELEQKMQQSPNTPPALWTTTHTIKGSLGEEISNPILF
ncbi:MAG TPA: squalene synthase [Chitinophagales bacterium]